MTRDEQLAGAPICPSSHARTVGQRGHGAPGPDGPGAAPSLFGDWDNDDTYDLYEEPDTPAFWNDPFAPDLDLRDDSPVFRGICTAIAITFAAVFTGTALYLAFGPDPARATFPALAAAFLVWCAHTLCHPDN